MTNKPGPEGARWSVPDWNPEEGDASVNYLDHIQNLERQLQEAREQINRLQATGSSASQGYVDPDSLNEPPKPRLNPIPIVGAAIPRNLWNRQHRILRDHAKILASDIKGKDKNGVDVDFTDKFSPTQRAELTKFGYTYPSPNQDDWIYSVGRRLIVETTILQELFSNRLLDINALNDTELNELREVPICSDELRRRKDIGYTEEAKLEIEKMASLKKLYDSTIAHCEGMPQKIHELELQLKLSETFSGASLAKEKKKVLYLGIGLVIALMFSAYGLFMK